MVSHKTSLEARRFLHVGIPYHYVRQNNYWKALIKAKDKVASRTFTMPVKGEERFYLHMLLLQVSHATNFKYLMTVDNVVYNSFKEAAFHCHMLDLLKDIGFWKKLVKLVIIIANEPQNQKLGLLRWKVKNIRSKIGTKMSVFV